MSLHHNSPFRAEIVGSFLRPDAIKKARDAHHEGRISHPELRAIEDEEIRKGLFKLGIEVMPGSAYVLRERVSSDTRRWEKVIKTRKMELQ